MLTLNPEITAFLADIGYWPKYQANVKQVWGQKTLKL